MGYCVDWKGILTLDAPLTVAQANELRGYEETEVWPEGPDRRFNPWQLGKDSASFTVETDKPGDWKAWLQYTIDHFLTPWGRTLSGSVTWKGEERGDAGTATVEGGRVKARRPTAAGWESIPEHRRRRMISHIEDVDDEEAVCAVFALLGAATKSDRTVFDAP